MKPAIKIKNLHKVYQNGTEALKNLNFEVGQGEFFALLGPNGSGKTTTINIMAGPTIKTSGTVEICGLDLDRHRQETKFMLGVVPQEISFDSFFTVNETLILQSGYYGIKNNQKHIDDILEKLDLHGKKHSRTRTLSGGMKRRLLVAKALIHKPKVLVLDEPTAGVDVELRHGLWNYMRKLNRDGLTILLTTHYIEEAETLCSRTAIINKGELIALDKTTNLVRSMGDRKKMTLNFKEKIREIPSQLKLYTPQKISDYDLEITFETACLDKVLSKIKDLNPNDIDLKGQSLEDVFIELTRKQNG